jgi:UDP-3-O-[3-hydroxymyristoyl] N-acetylglucosamine deacetylase
MNSIYQKTISKPLKFEGIGLHSGKKSKITLIPAANNQGVIFKRVDVKLNNLIKANYQNVFSARLCTTLQNENGLKVSTVEHLMAALYVAGIDNVIIEIDNEEVPIMDGSAKIFLEKLKKTETI